MTFFITESQTRSPDVYAPHVAPPYLQSFGPAWAVMTVETAYSTEGLAHSLTVDYRPDWLPGEKTSDLSSAGCFEDVAGIGFRNKYLAEN